jgi:hypothetical protein
MMCSDCNAQCADKADVAPTAFKGHAVFAWKEASSYLFIWLPATNALIPRKRVATWHQDAECIVSKQMKKMKGLKQTMTFYFIENPRSPSFLNKDHNPMRPKEEFSDLIERLNVLAQENEINLIFRDIKDAGIKDGF